MTLVEGNASEVLHAEGVAQEVVEAIAACGHASRVRDAFAALAGSFGFDGLSYLLVGCSPGQPRLIEHWTTAAADWPACYAMRGYHLVDPRVVHTRQRAVPVTWSARDEACNWRRRDFLRDADRHRIRGGIAWSLHDARVGRAVIAWDSPHADGMPIRARLGTLALLAGYLHEAIVAQRKAVTPPTGDSPLTDRERECVALVARGMTSADVGVKLGITTRTANFHMGNVMSKLGAASRSEAIARAVAANLVSLDS